MNADMMQKTVDQMADRLEDMANRLEELATTFEAESHDREFPENETPDQEGGEDAEKEGTLLGMIELVTFVPAEAAIFSAIRHVAKMTRGLKPVVARKLAEGVDHVEKLAEGVEHVEKEEE